MIGYLVALGLGAAGAYYYDKQKTAALPSTTPATTPAANPTPPAAPAPLPAPSPAPGALPATVSPTQASTGALLTGVDPAVAHAQAINIGDSVIVSGAAIPTITTLAPSLGPMTEIQMHVDSLTSQDDPTGKFIIAHVNDPRLDPSLLSMLNAVSTPVSRDMIVRKVL